MMALTDKQRLVLDTRLGLRGPVLTLQQLGTELGVTKERVRQLEAGALRKLGRAAALRAEGIEVPASLRADLDRYQGLIDSSESELGGRFMLFEEARRYAHTLGVHSVREWQCWSKSGERPANIPSNPQTVYQERGWAGWLDFLGPRPGRAVLPFEQARDYARSLGLRSFGEWRRWCARGERPAYIPATPNYVYRNEGWAGWTDFLGYGGRRRHRRSPFVSFEAARRYVRGLGLRSYEEWQRWNSSEERPAGIPSRPHRLYRDAGWAGWPDFVGYPEARRRYAGPYRSFEQAREYARALGLRSMREWQLWSASEDRPQTSRLPRAKCTAARGGPGGPTSLGMRQSAHREGTTTHRTLARRLDPIHCRYQFGPAWYDIARGQLHS